MLRVARRMQITGYCYARIFTICQALVKEFYPASHNLLYSLGTNHPRLPQDIVVETLDLRGKLVDLVSL